ncbi:hypothetical protein EGI22_16915 [Lacihabitans sp. LS3-19]|nr:hypothetical protein [Lacihabitans sp. LS3-19]
MAQTKEPFQTKKFSGVSIKNVKVNTSGGGIKVAGNSQSNAEVRVYVKMNNWKGDASKAELEKELEKYVLEMNYENGSIVCLAKPKDPNGKNNKLSISFEVDCPKNVDVNLVTSGGGINLQNLEGNLDFKTSGGGLTVSNLKGKVNGKTSGGGIKLTDCDGMITMKTSGGGIKANNAKGNIYLATSGGGIDIDQLKGTIKAHTSGGSINSSNIKGSLDAATSGGSINLDNISGNLTAKTSGGGINADIVKLGEVLTLSTSAGNIHANLPFSEGMDLDIRGNKIKSDKLSKVSRNLNSGVVKGQVNGGGTEVKITAVSGTIYID